MSEAEQGKQFVYLPCVRHELWIRGSDSVTHSDTTDQLVQATVTDSHLPTPNAHCEETRSEVSRLTGQRGHCGNKGMC